MIDTRKTHIIRFGLSLLFLLLICIPLCANFNLPTRFGTNNPNKIDNPNVEAERKNNFDYKVYQSTIYDPFGNETPSSGGGGNPANNDGNGSGEDVGIPDWADTPSEPLPIADGTLFLLLLAVIATTSIAIKQRKQKQSTTMTPRKRTYHSLLQKLFMLLVFSGLAEQTTAQTVYKKRIFQNSDIENDLPTNFSTYLKGAYGYQGAVTNGKFYIADGYDGNRKRIYSIPLPANDNTTPTVATHSISTDAQWGTCTDDSCNLIVNTSDNRTSVTHLTIFKKGDLNNSQRIKLSTEISGQCDFISAKGDVWSGTGYVYLFPASTKTVKIVTITDRTYKSITTRNVSTKAASNGGYVIPIASGTTRFIYQRRSGDTGITGGYHLYDGSDKGQYLANNGTTQPNLNNTFGGAVFTIGGQEMFVHPSGSHYNGGWSLRKLNTNKDFILSQEPLGNQGYGTEGSENGSCGEFFTVEKIDDYTVKLYEYCQANGIAAWVIGYEVPKTIRVQTYSGSGTTWSNSVTGGTISNVTYTSGIDAMSTSVTTSESKSISVNQGSTVRLTATAKSGYTFIGWWNQGVASTSTTYNHPADGTTDASITARFAQCYNQTPRVATYNPSTGTYQQGTTGGTVKINYDDGTGTSSNNSNKTATVSNSSSYRAIINSTVTLTATPATGYILEGWYSGNTRLDWASDLECAYIADKAYTITARFAKTINREFRAQTYDGTAWQTNTTGGTVNITYNGSTTASISSTNPLKITGIHEGSQIQLQATANAGYQFLYWQCQWSRGSNSTCTINALDTLYNINNSSSSYSNNSYTARVAKYVQQTFNIRTYSAATSSYEANANGGKIAITYTYKDFKSTLNADKTMVSKVDETHSHTITDVNNHSYDIIHGAPVTLTATPTAGYSFSGWYEGETLKSASPTYTYNVATDDATISARFARAQQTHTVAIMTYDPDYNKYLPDNPGGSVTYKVRVPGSSTPELNVTTTTAASFSAAVGRDITLTATAIDGFSFEGWYEGESLIANSDTHTFTATDVARHFIARFAPTKSERMMLKLVPNSAGTYTVKYGEFIEIGQDVSNFYSKESSLTETVITYGPNPLSYGVSSAKPILGYEFYKMYPNANTGSYAVGLNEYSKTPQQGGDDNSRLVVVDFVRTEEQMVYLDLNKQWGHNNHQYYVYATNIARRNKPTEEIPRYHDIKFEWIPMSQVAGQDYYTASRPIPANTYSHIVFVQFAAGAATPTVAISELTTQPTNQTNHLTIPATRFDCYKLNSYYKNGAMTDAWTYRPAADGDFRLLYREASNANYEHASDVIKKAANGKTDIVSLHIYKENNPTLTLQQRTSGTWSDIQSVTPPATSGVYNFTIQQNSTSATVTGHHTYTGNYYIRTVNAAGMYQDYTHPDNILTHSEYAQAHSDFSHYYCRYIDIPAQGLGDGNQVGTYTSVKFAVANDYAYFLTKELLISNDRFANDEYADDNFVERRGGSEPRLSVDAHVRFGWDIHTNRLTRAYIANPQAVGNDYLILEGNNLAATTFTEGADHIYHADLQAKPNTSATITATTLVDTDDGANTFHNELRKQYFFGTEGSPSLLVGGAASSVFFPIRVTYDFKHDRLTTTYTPNGEITGIVNLETPVMIMREHNDPPTQITFPTEGTNRIVLPDGEDAFAQPAYAVMTFRGNILTDPAITHHEKMFYWVSFPFDVKISDIFGLGAYGKYWIMQEYNGAQRAQYGLKYTNWQYITNTGATLYANTGYLICLNYSQLVTDGIVTSSKNASLYFPSSSNISAKNLEGGQSKIIDLASYTNANTAWNHHNWHLIGVPSFAAPTLTDIQTDVPFVYVYWHPGDAYAAKAYNEITFHAMHSYMVQYAGEITWESVVNTGGNLTPQGLAAKASAEDKPVMLRLELQQAGSTLDKTYVQLRNDKGTKGFDLNLDLSKIINAGANIYSVVNSDQMAGNAMPKVETVLPIGVVISAAGEYTFAMPQGTEGMFVELIDYEQGTATNLLLSDYIVTLPKGTFDQRFALRLVPDKVATGVENIGGANGEKQDVRKYIIDGLLYLQKGNITYDAQGRIIQY